MENFDSTTSGRQAILRLLSLVKLTVSRGN